MMASKNGNRQVSVASSAEPSVLGPKILSKLVHKKESSAKKLKLLKVVPPKSKNDVHEEPLSPTSLSPILNEVDDNLRASFNSARPMGDSPDALQCKHCKKPILKPSAAAHIKICLQKKIDRAQRKKEQKEAARKAREAREKGKVDDGDGDDGNGDEGSGNDDKTAGKTAGGANGLSSNAKKRKADGEADSEPKKKKTKKEIEKEKPKTVKPKGPVDVEKQCGVLLPNGAFCARSLTCKSHAMGAKRAVPGRSLPYDMLLNAYQKKNQAKQQKAAIDANAPLPDDLADPSGPIDSDEEKDAVMAAIARSRPRPAAHHVFVPVRKKYAYIRMKEMLSQALGVRNGGNIFGGIGSATTSGSAGAQGDTGLAADSERRASAIVVPGSARSSLSGASGVTVAARKQSASVAAGGA